ncbi:MAG: CotH kinase family protein [Bacteroidota bacterium]
MRLSILSFLGVIILCGKISAQNFYDQNTIQKIEIQFTQSNWDYQLDTAKVGAEGYIMAASVTINGVYFDSVGVKYKGNSSYNPTYNKNPLHIELDGFKDQSYLGIKDIKLGNNYADPSMIREVLGYDILKNYMHCPEANFAKVYINGAYHGVYSNVESIGKKFYAKHYHSSGNTAIKCNPIVNPSANTKSNLKYFTTGDSSNYFNFYELKSDYGWNSLRALADTVTNHQSRFASNVDVDRLIWMLAFNNVNVNLDSYSGAFCQNYYLYKDNTNHYNTTIWDLNMCFGGFPYLGNSNSSLAQLNITSMQQMLISIHATDVYWPMINIINSNAQYKKMLVAHMRTIVNEYIASGNYITRANQFQALIDTSVQSDNFKFYSYPQFQTGLTSNVSVGSYSVPGISNLMSARLIYLQGTAEFGYTAPVISAVAANTNSPAINTTVAITANVVNTNTVYLGYRTDNHQKFTRVLMYDDGAHSDGVSGDNVYGTSITVTSAETEYYIFAENTNAGIFSPERAEHEFHVLQTNLAQPNSGEVVINEFLAANNFGQADENGKHEDWIELYNTTNATLNLSGLYLSDDYANPTKYTIPNNTIIQPNGFLTIWADEDNTNEAEIHCNFKLLNSGEKIMLSKNTTVLDSITFGFQGADISMARCPDGMGAFAASSTPTYNNSNCAVGINEINMDAATLTVFPNPANDEITIICSANAVLPVEVLNVVGDMILEEEMNQRIKINTSALSQGIYFVKVLNKTLKIVITH